MMIKYLNWDWRCFYLLPNIKISKLKSKWLNKYGFKGWTILEFHWLFLIIGIQIINE